MSAECLVVDAVSSGCLFDAEPSPRRADQDCPARVARLFSPRCPMAIVRFVVTVIVDAIEGKPWAPSRPHVRPEHLEALPPLAYANATPTVISETSYLRVLASEPHAFPNSVDGMRLTHAVRAGPVPAIAPTACDGAVQYWIPANLFHSAAIAAHKDVVGRPASWGLTKNGQSAESLPENRGAHLLGHVSQYTPIQSKIL